MNEICSVFKQKKKVFIPFITAGFPSYGKFIEIVKMFEDVGAGIVEIGLPFSDPLADGKVIQDSSKFVLDKGINLDIILELVSNIKRTSKIPLVFMTYYNLILARGIKKFINDAVLAGVQGIIVPDLPPEEAGELLKQAKNKLAVTFLVSMVTDKQREKYIAKSSTGFIYFVSRLGVTGQGMSGIDKLESKVRSLKRITDKPVAVGFGVSKRADAKKVYQFADGLIVGSAIIDFIDKNKEQSQLISNLEKYCKQFVV